MKNTHKYNAYKYLQNILKHSFYTDKELLHLIDVDKKTLKEWKAGKGECRGDQFKRALNIHGYHLGDYLANTKVNPLKIGISLNLLRKNDKHFKNIEVFAKLNEIYANVRYMDDFSRRK